MHGDDIGNNWVIYKLNYLNLKYLSYKCSFILIWWIKWCGGGGRGREIGICNYERGWDCLPFCLIAWRTSSENINQEMRKISGFLCRGELLINHQRILSWTMNISYEDSQINIWLILVLGSKWAFFFFNFVVSCDVWMDF